MALDISKLNITVFDLEIKEVIGQNGIGWKSYDKMGISVGCSYNFLRREYKIYMDDNLDELAELIASSQLVSGFNTMGFDIPLLEATLKAQVRKDNHYDILQYSREAHGSGPFKRGFKLDNHLAGTFGKDSMKTANGEQAPVWWQEGKIGRVASYCLDDVTREARLFKRLWETGRLTLDTHGEIVFKTIPQAVFGRVA